MNDNRSPDQRDNDRRLLAEGLRYGSLVTEFVLLTLIPGYFGYRLDQHYGWSSWGMLSGILLGMGLGLWMLIRQMKKLNR